MDTSCNVLLSAHHAGWDVTENACTLPAAHSFAAFSSLYGPTIAARQSLSVVRPQVLLCRACVYASSIELPSIPASRGPWAVPSGRFCSVCTSAVCTVQPCRRPVAFRASLSQLARQPRMVCRRRKHLSLHLGRCVVQCTVSRKLCLSSLAESHSRHTLSWCRCHLPAARDRDNILQH